MCHICLCAPHEKSPRPENLDCSVLTSRILGRIFHISYRHVAFAVFFFLITQTSHFRYMWIVRTMRAGAGCI